MLCRNQYFFFFQAEDGIRDLTVTGVQTCALPISIEVSPTDANVVLLGGNVVFKTTDGGEHWASISPDLTRNDKSKQVTSGGPINYDISGAETYNTILTINFAPTDANVIWTGSDDGLVHVTRDGGKTWTNVSGRFPGLAPGVEGRVYQIGVSPFDAGTAYLSVDRHPLDDRRPYVYKTTDYGKTWTDIARGLPQEVPARVGARTPTCAASSCSAATPRCGTRGTGARSGSP